jgi:hypothetical protein
LETSLLLSTKQAGPLCSEWDGSFIFNKIWLDTVIFDGFFSFVVRFSVACRTFSRVLPNCGPPQGSPSALKSGYHSGKPLSISKLDSIAPGPGVISYPNLLHPERMPLSMTF